MAGSEIDPMVRQAASDLAQQWLVSQDYCDCAPQRLLVAQRLIPAVAMFRYELRQLSPRAIEDMAARLAIYCTHAHREIARGLHRPGASAALPAERWGHNGVGPHC